MDSNEQSGQVHHKHSILGHHWLENWLEARYNYVPSDPSHCRQSIDCDHWLPLAVDFQRWMYYLLHRPKTLQETVYSWITALYCLSLIGTVWQGSHRWFLEIDLWMELNFNQGEIELAKICFYLFTFRFFTLRRGRRCSWWWLCTRTTANPFLWKE